MIPVGARNRIEDSTIFFINPRSRDDVAFPVIDEQIVEQAPVEEEKEEPAKVVEAVVYRVNSLSHGNKFF